MIEVFEKNDIENFEGYAEVIAQWSIGLWWSDFEGAEIARCYIAFDGDIPVGFQTVNRDGFCVAIEVKEQYQGMDIARMLIEESECRIPDRNENPGFWSAIQEEYAVC